MKILPIIVFDFDGVISPGGEKLKNSAWDRLSLLPHPTHTTASEWQSALLKARTVFGIGLGLGSRYDIIAHALTFTGLASHPNDLLVAQWADAYNDSVQKMIIERGVYLETTQMLTHLTALGYTLYINTATPTYAVKNSLNALGLESFFTEVYGQPNSKIENMYIIANREEIEPATLLFIGDSSGDVLTARAVNCTFIGVLNDSNNWVDTQFPLIKRLDELTQYL